MNILFVAYHEAIYRPLLNLLVWGYNSVPGHDVGIVIIALTIVVRLILAPTMHKQLKSQGAMAKLQPKLDEIKTRYKDDKEAQSRAVMELYREHKVNPLGSCLPLLIQLPILIALYQVFNTALNGNLNGLYHIVSNPGTINPYFLGLMNLAKPNIGLAVLAGVLQYWQSRLMQSQNKTKPTDATAKAIQWQTMYFLPLFSVFIAWRLPAGLPLYWVVTTLFAVAQQYYIMRKSPESEVQSTN